MKCIHGGDELTCKICSRPKENLFTKDSDPQRIERYNDGKYERKDREFGHQYRLF